MGLNGNPYDSFTVRGSGGIPQQPTTVTSEENLLPLVEDRTRFWAEDITVHEWAHAIENLGFDDETRTKWQDLFDRARAAGLWPGTFAMAVDGGREFFAELPQSFFGVNNEIGRAGGPAQRRSDQQYGPRYQALWKISTGRRREDSTPQRRTVGHGVKSRSPCKERE